MGWGGPESDVIVKTLWLILEYCGSSLQLSLAWLHHVFVTALRGSWVGFGWLLWVLREVLGAQVGGQDGQVETEEEGERSRRKEKAGRRGSK